MEKIDIKYIQNQLKNCPFCGNSAFIFKNEYMLDCARTLSIYYGSGCETSECRCECDPDECYFEVIDDAINQWETRNE